MAQMEEDLGTQLDWVAVDHLDTAHPHTDIDLLPIPPFKSRVFGVFSWLERRRLSGTVHWIV